MGVVKQFMHRTAAKVVLPNLSESLKKYANLCKLGKIAASFARPTASLPLYAFNYGRGLIIYAKNTFKSCCAKF